MMGWIGVFLGGGLGCLARFGISELMTRSQTGFPWATLVANGLSCIVLGILTGLLLSNPQQDSPWRYYGMIGFCGGFSTFSTFTAENFQLLQNGQLVLALTNILVSVIVCLACFYLGFKLIEAG